MRRLYLRWLGRRARRRGGFLGVVGEDGVLRSVREHEEYRRGT